MWGDVASRTGASYLTRRFAKEVLEPVQLGVGVKDATAHIAIAMSRLLPKILASPSVGILQLDISNAFNTVSRACILCQVQLHASELYPWAVWSLSRRSLLFCQDEQLTNECGVHQGSPLGPLLFALALHEVIASSCRHSPKPGLVFIWTMATLTLCSKHSRAFWANCAPDFQQLASR